MLQIRNNTDEEFSEGDRYYWKIPKGLPSEDLKVPKMKFKLHDEKWEYQAYYTYENELKIAIVNSDYYDDSVTPLLFEVRGGIVGDDNKELVALKARREENKFLIGTVIKKSELDAIMLINEAAYIFVEIKSTEESQEIVAYVQSIDADSEEFLLDGRTSDMTIQVEQKKFRCHKCVLGTKSPVFSAMMEHDMQEKQSGLVIIQDADPDTFREFLLFLYTENKNYLNWNKMIDLYKLGDKYVVDSLKNLCVSHIYKKLTTKNFYEFFLLSQQHNDSELRDVVFHFFVKRSSKIVRSKRWMTFLCENPAASNMLIANLADSSTTMRSQMLSLCDDIVQSLEPLEYIRNIFS